MHILFVLQYYYPYVGGLESLFKNLTEGLAERGHHVKVVTTLLRKTNEREILNDVEIERVRVPFWADRYFFTVLGVPRANLAARNCDLVHTTPYTAVVPAFIAARRWGLPIVFTALEVLGSRWHTVERNIFRAFSYRAFEKLTTSLPYDRFAAISKATLDDCLTSGMDGERGQVIYPGVDKLFVPAPRTGALRKRCRIPDDAFLYMYYGRPGKTKGVDVLLAAAPLIQKSIPNAFLVLVLADQPRRQYLEMCALAKNLESLANILILPSLPRQELVTAIRDADCVVIPSRTEGFGLTAAEACATGTPVVATRAGSLPESVSGRHILVEAGSPKSIADGVTRIWRGEWQETSIHNYVWDAMVDAYVSLYKEILRQ